MKNEKELMFGLIASVIFGDNEISLPKTVNEETLKKLYSISCRHDVAQVVALGLEKASLLPDGEIKNAFSKQKMLSVFRREQQDHELSRITEALEHAEIDNIPLKGSVIKRFYPEEWLRTSSDIDILIKPEEYDKAVKAIEKLGYSFDSKSLYEAVFISKNGVNLELHFGVKSPDKNVISVLERIWDNALPNKHRYELTDEFLIFYTVAHAHAHFITGGCGVRPFIDLKLLKDKLEYSEEKLQRLIDESGMTDFYKGMSELSEVWFESKPHSELTALMEDYIISGGVYGNRNNYGAVGRYMKGSKFKYYLSRIFVSKNRLIQMSPLCEKYPILMPYYQVKRWFLLLNKKYAGAAKAEIKGTHDEKLTARMLKELGF